MIGKDLQLLIITFPGQFGRRPSGERRFLPGGTGVVQWKGVSWEDASLAAVAALACLLAWLLSCPQAGLKSESKVGLEVAEAIPSFGPVMGSIEDDRKFQEDELGPCGVPGVRLVSPPSLTLSQFSPLQSLSLLSIVTPSQRPLRC
jgi:hypothetical protein